nr:reverse transcriptase domain-containing protein [Tanacetum cinerariifolium]
VKVVEDNPDAEDTEDDYDDNVDVNEEDEAKMLAFEKEEQEQVHHIWSGNSMKLLLNIGWRSWKIEVGQKQNVKKGGFRNQKRSDRKQDRFTLLTKTPKEILALNKENFKPPPPMTTPVEKRKASKFYEFHGEVGQRQQKGGNLRKGQDIGNTNGAAMAEGIQIKDHLNILSEDSDIIPTPRGGGWDERSYDYRSRDGGTLCPPGEVIWPLGQISLLVKIGDEEHSTSAWMNFMVVRSLSPYNGIIGRPGVRRIQAVLSTAHRMLKFPVTCGTVTLRSSMIIPLECMLISGLGVQQPIIDHVAEEKVQVAIHIEYPEQTIAIGSTLTEERRKELCGLLRHNFDTFAWKLADMTGVSRHIMEHRLNIREGRLPVRQKKWGHAPEKIRQSIKK